MTAEINGELEGSGTRSAGDRDAEISQYCRGVGRRYLAERQICSETILVKTNQRAISSSIRDVNKHMTHARLSVMLFQMCVTVYMRWLDVITNIALIILQRDVNCGVDAKRLTRFSFGWGHVVVLVTESTTSTVFSELPFRDWLCYSIEFTTRWARGCLWWRQYMPFLIQNPRRFHCS